MYLRQSRPCIARTNLPPILARGGIARVAALMLICLLVIPTACLCATSSDLVTPSNCLFQDGTVSIGYLRNGTFVDYNTQFAVREGVVGWCMDKAPGPEGDVTINITKAPISRGGAVWQPGVLYVSPGDESKAVAVRFKPSKAQAVSCVASFAVKPGSGDKVTVRLAKNSADLKTATMDTTQKQDSTVLSSVTPVELSDTLYFIIGNIEQERSGLVGVQLFVTPDAAKVDATKSIKPAFVSSK